VRSTVRAPADDPPVGLQACAYLHNYHFEDDDVLLSEAFRPAIERDRLFSADDVRGLCEFLSAHLDGGGGLDILPRIEENRFRPSKKLMDHVARVIKERSEYVLLDEQLVVFERVLDCIRKGHQDRRKRVRNEARSRKRHSRPCRGASRAPPG